MKRPCVGSTGQAAAGACSRARLSTVATKRAGKSVSRSKAMPVLPSSARSDAAKSAGGCAAGTGCWMAGSLAAGAAACAGAAGGACTWAASGSASRP